MHKHNTSNELVKDNASLQTEKFQAAKKSTLVSIAVNLVLSLWQIIIGIFLIHKD